MVTSLTMKHRQHLDKVGLAGASIVWYGGIFVGILGVIAGIIWILVLSQVIPWSTNFLWALIILCGGVGIIIFSIYLKKVIVASMKEYG